MLKPLCLYLFLPLLSSLLLFSFFTFSTPKSKTLTFHVSSPVRITRDSLNIPHIYSDSIEDAIYTLGFCMCEDRMWQMDMIRRASTGRLSEILGNSEIDVDTYIRNMKLRIFAAEDVKALPKKTKEVGLRFVDGINDAAAMRWLPIEYYLTGGKWENFTLVDVQAGLYFSALMLSNIWGSDVLKVQMRKVLGRAAEFLIPAGELVKARAFAVDNSELSEELKGPAEQLKSSDFSDLIDFYTQVFDEGLGSNAFVLSGNHTKSGKPILSNDPHVNSFLPSQLYLSHLTVKNFSVYGGGSIGYPTYSNGITKDFAWGMTSLKVDDIDIYAEKQLNSTHYLFGDEALKFTTFTEVIKIKDKEPVTITFRETVHGPVLENSIAGVKVFVGTFGDVSTKVLAICWASNGAEDRSIGFAHALINFKSVDDLAKALAGVSAVRINYIAGSSNGDIMYHAAGRVPIKQYRGDSVLPGWLPETMWKGFIPHDELPYTKNPEKGFIVTANNFIANNQYKYFESVGSYFSQGRAERITEIIQEGAKSGKKFTTEDLIEIMKDDLDIYARISVPLMLEKVKQTKYKEKMEEMKKWDFVMAPESQVAGVYARWIIQVVKNLLKSRVSENIVQCYLRNQVLHNNFHLIFSEFYEEIKHLCDDPHSEAVESCEDLVTQSFEEAVEYVDGRNWGEMHAALIKPFPYSQSKYLKWLSERNVKVGGWANTVHASFSDWNSTFAAKVGPALRFAVDLGNKSANYWSLDTGVSENMISRHYTDMLDNDYYYGGLFRFEYLD